MIRMIDDFDYDDYYEEYRIYVGSNGLYNDIGKQFDYEEDAIEYANLLSNKPRYSGNEIIVCLDVNYLKNGKVVYTDDSKTVWSSDGLYSESIKRSNRRRSSRLKEAASTFGKPPRNEASTQISFPS